MYGPSVSGQKNLSAVLAGKGGLRQQLPCFGLGHALDGFLQLGKEVC